MIRTKCGVALAVCVTSLVSASRAVAQTDITGTWIVAVESPQGSTNVEAVFKQNGDKVTGEVESPMGKVALSGTLIKNDLLVSYALPAQENTMAIKMIGVVKGGQMSGTFDFGGVGQSGWTAKRKPVGEASTTSTAAPRASGAVDDVTGKWEITMRLPQAQFPMSAMLEQTGEAVSGALAGPMGPMPLTGTMVGRNLTLVFKTVTPQGDTAVTLTGELDTEGLKGKTVMPGFGAAEWVGKRVQ